MNTPNKFLTIDYLISGNVRQQRAYQELLSLNVFEHLKPFQPILTGTIPIDIDIASSDLDIICFCEDQASFKKKVKENFGQYPNFHMMTVVNRSENTTVATFQGEYFLIELFCQAIPTTEQYAFRHMIIEDALLTRFGDSFKAEVRALKRAGYKTEPAFAQLLGLSGDPYDALLEIDVNRIEIKPT